MAAGSTVTVRGSYGDLTVHRATGVIIEYDAGDELCWDRKDEGYHDIGLFLPLSFARWPDTDDFDILDTSFIDRTGRVTPLMVQVTVRQSGDDEDWTMWGEDLLLLPAPEAFV